jgi:hypothetical protein
MAGTYKLVELVGTSAIGFDDAVKNAVAEAAQSLRHLDWFEVVEQRGMLKDGAVREYQAVIKVGFKLER